ncbi:mandelate racemase/muconate lactonizing enzyme family protein [Chloroflexota bacterium]
MHITSLETFVHCPNRNWTFVKLQTDEGIYGWGETTILGHEQTVEACIKDLGAYLIGRDPRLIEMHFSTMLRNSWFRPSIIILSAISAVEMAMWDILGKSLDAPVHALLGGACRRELPVYLNDWNADCATLEEVPAAARRAVAAGAKALKWDPLPLCDLYPPVERLERAARSVREVRQAVGDNVKLMIDCLGRLSPENAARLARDVEECKLFWFEEPIPPDGSIDEYAVVAAATNAPICIGERIASRRGFKAVLENRVAGVINPDAGHSGGILEARKIADMADAYFIPVNPHNCGGPVLTAANMHIGATIPNFLIYEHFISDMPHFKRIVKSGLPDISTSEVKVNDLPGLGIDLDEEELRKGTFKRFSLEGMWPPNYDSV